MRKLSASQVRQYRRKLYEEQEGICPLCLLPLPKETKQTAIDHDHITGEIRGLLHLGCNRVEGVIFKSVSTYGKQGKDYATCVPFLERLVVYLKKGGKGIIYHLHKTPEEKAEAAKKRAAAKARAKRKAKEK